MERLGYDIESQAILLGVSCEQLMIQIKEKHPSALFFKGDDGRWKATLDTFEIILEYRKDNA